MYLTVHIPIRFRIPIPSSPLVRTMKPTAKCNFCVTLHKNITLANVTYLPEIFYHSSFRVSVVSEWMQCSSRITSFQSAMLLWYATSNCRNLKSETYCGAKSYSYLGIISVLGSALLNLL